jgi:DNA replication protein DnaC
MIQCVECDAAVADEIQRRAERDLKEREYRNLRHSGLPIDYRTGSRTLGDVPLNVEALEFCLSLGGELRGLFLNGPAGSFKTTVAAAFLARKIREGVNGRYVFIPDLFSDVHASYNDNSGETRAALVEACIRPTALVLDDLGKEKASEHAAGVILEILDNRYRNSRHGDWLIVTSNYDLDCLCDRFPREQFGDPIRRRLAELTVDIPMRRV